MATKHCSDCKLDLDLEAFGSNRRESDGKAGICKKCSRQRNKQFRLRQKYEVLRHYGGDTPTCACCGESIIEFLTLDHIDGSGYLHRKSGITGAKFYTWIRHNNFPQGFRVLCMNCNFVLGAYGYCPHSGGSRMSCPIMKGRARGEANGTSKLSAAEVTAIRDELSAGETTHAVSKKHGLNRLTVVRIRDRKTWVHI